MQFFKDVVKNPFYGIILLLSSVLGVITYYSLSLEPFTIELKQSDAGIYLVNTISKPDTALNNPPVIIDSAEIEPPVIFDSTAQSILLIGDSMLEGLSPRLNQCAVHNGHNFNAVLWYGSSTKSFGTSDTLSFFIKKYKPSYVLVSLGANELFFNNIKKDRQKYVEHIMSQLGDIPYLWIGPPNWKPDTGINDLIIEHTRKGCYFPSKRLSFDRAKDGAHPTRVSAAKWADSLCVYLTDSAAYRIIMHTPDTVVKIKGNGVRDILKMVN